MEGTPAVDGRAQNEHDATAGKGDASLSVLGNQSASVYDRRDPSDEDSELQVGRSSSAHADPDKTMLSVMGDTSESVYDKPEAEADAGHVGGWQPEVDEPPQPAPEIAEEAIEEPDAA